ncbi:hypothetical protein BH20ACT2_BH20ACT2_20980 [soil metagenome]
MAKPVKRKLPKGRGAGAAAPGSTGTPNRTPTPKPTGGRATPKGGARPETRRAPEPGGRYTPPIPRSEKVSPWWVPALMFGLLGVGVVVIFCNYVGLLPGGEASNTYLLVGLGFILAGIITATQYH